MKLDQTTILALKTFASVKNNIVLQKGSKQYTASAAQDVAIIIELDQDIPEEIGIYDLSLFLNNVTALDNPEIKFEYPMMTIADDTVSVSFMACDKTLVKQPSREDIDSIQITDEDVEVKFTLSSDILMKAISLARQNDIDALAFVGVNGKLQIQAFSPKNDSSNRLVVKMDQVKTSENKTYALLNREHLFKTHKNVDYTVTILCNFV